MTTLANERLAELQGTPVGERGCPTRFIARSPLFLACWSQVPFLVPDAAARPGAVLGGQDGVDDDFSRRLPDFPRDEARVSQLGYPFAN